MTTFTGNFYLDIGFFLLGFFMVMFKEFFPFNIIWKYFKIFLLVFFGTLAWRSIKKYLSDDK